MGRANNNNNNNNKKKNTKPSSADDGMAGWIASLVAKQQQVLGETAAEIPTTTKEERIQKRAAKKAERQERHDQQRKRSHRPEDNNNHNKKDLPHKAKQQRSMDSDSTNKRRLKRIAQWMISLRTEHSDGDQKRSSHGVKYTIPAQVPVKRTRALNEVNLQPRPSDYSGIGLARKSLFIPFQDPSHIPKLEQEFKEHIPGFFGRQRTKAMKKQLDGNMLWRQLANQKADGSKGVLPKKFANLSPDARVQAMIDAGLI